MTQAPPTLPTTPPTFGLPHRGGMILTLGIVSLSINVLSMMGGTVFVPCCLVGVIPIATAIPAWVMAGRDLKLMQMGRMDRAGYSSTSSGKVCAIISLVISGVELLAGIAMLLLGVAALFAAAAAGGGP